MNIYRRNANTNKEYSVYINTTSGHVLDSDYLYIDNQGKLKNLETIYSNVALRYYDQDGKNTEALENYVMYLLEKEGEKVHNEINNLLAN